jgi:hypothetical protein
MVEIVQLTQNENPPAEGRWLLIQWMPGEGAVTNATGGQTTQLVPEHLWPFWLEEGPALAERTGLSKVYFKGPPNA